MDKAMHSELEGHTKTPEWYNENQMYHWLIRENYSENIAKELSFKWAKDLQGAFNKGFEKGTKENQSLRSELQKQKEEIQRFELERTEMYDKYEKLEKSLNTYHEQRLEAWRELEKQKELNAELVVCLEGMRTIYNKYANDDPYEDHINDHAESLIKKYNES